MTAPRSQARNPPWDIRAVLVVLKPETPRQGGFLIDEDKDIEPHPNCNSVFEDADAAEKQPLTENQRHDCNIHGISHIPKPPSDNQMLRWEDWCGCTETLEGETSEGLQKHWKTRRNKERSQDPQGGCSQQRCSNMPLANSPRHVTCDDPRGDDKEYRRAKNGEYSPHSTIRFRPFHTPECIRPTPENFRSILHGINANLGTVIGASRNRYV